MRKIDLLFAEYSESHRNETNKLIHWICVPLIFWSILGFISLIPAPHIFVVYFGFISIISIIGILSVTAYYATLSWKIAAVMLLVMLFFEWIISTVNLNFGRDSWIIYAAVFVLAWIGQFYGHKIEGKKPSFLKDLQFLLVGPAWLLHFLMKNAGIRY